MKWPSIFSRKETAVSNEAPATGIKGATIRISSDPSKFKQTAEIQQEMNAHKEFCDIYETTVAGAIIDTETDDIFAQGWALIGDDPDEVAKVREYLAAVPFETELKKLCVESKVYGFGLAEVGKQGARHVLVAHSSYNIFPKMDDDGWLDSFVQMGKNDQILTEWSRNEVITLALRPNASTPGTGRSELAQAYTAIVDYENIRRANAEMILRMGYPTYDVEFQDTDGVVPASALEGDVADIAPGSIFSTGVGAKINTLNGQGVTQVQAYAETALQAVAVAMQVPRSMAGLSDNSEATAKVTQAKYYNRIGAEQGIIAQTVQSRYLDTYVLPDCDVRRGAVQIVFNSPDPEAQLKKAQILQIITSLDPTDPEYLLSVEEQAELWGKHPKAGEYDQTKILDTIKDGIMHHIAEVQGLTPPAEAPQEGQQ